MRQQKIVRILGDAPVPRTISGALTGIAPFLAFFLCCHAYGGIGIIVWIYTMPPAGLLVAAILAVLMTHHSRARTAAPASMRKPVSLHS
ncbi:hypothetical protein [Neoasaia chiangmaiensis]|nr:hypothetical protein [Neoasaia chiangmaiensis]